MATVGVRDWCEHKKSIGSRVWTIRGIQPSIRRSGTAGAVTMGRLVVLNVATLFRLFVCGIALSIAACTVSTGILPAGPNTYALTQGASVLVGGSMTAQQNALGKANAFCTEQGREFIAVQMLAVPSANPDGPTRYSVTFRCLLPNDPAFAPGGKT